MKAINNIPVIAHEVGHYLHYLLFPSSGLVKGRATVIDEQWG
jgi:hypothetical protein